MTGGDGLLEGYSFEVTAKDSAKVIEAAALIPPGTQVNVTSLAGEDVVQRSDAVRVAGSLGFVPVPHLSARRFASRGQLVGQLDALVSAGATQEVFVVAGDAPSAEGPFDSSLDVIVSGCLGGVGLSRVGFGGYPEGHPHIDDATLWDALASKSRAATEQGLRATVTTQLAFDADRVLAWVAEARERPLGCPVRIGVAGPVGAKQLLGYASRFGVASSAGILRKYGFSLTNLLSTAGPEHFVADLQDGYDPARHGVLGLHFYTFGAVRATADWVASHHVGV